MMFVLCHDRNLYNINNTDPQDRFVHYDIKYDFVKD